MTDSADGNRARARHSSELGVDGSELGVDGALLQAADAGQFRTLAVSMLDQARRELCLFSQELEAERYGDEAFVSAVISLALRTPASQVRILLQNPAPAIKRGHRLIDACLRFSSAMQVRQVGKELLDYRDEFLLVDRCGYMLRAPANSAASSLNFNDRRRVAGFEKFFDEAWSGSSLVPEFRRLHL